MKGYLLLCEARSGSNWLGDLANKTAVMGVTGEWLSSLPPKRPSEEASGEAFFTHVVERSATENGNFGTKIFFRHLMYVHDEYGYDFILKCRDTHDMKIILLKRRDLIGQAISEARGIQTQQWTSAGIEKAVPDYDFRQICKSYFHYGHKYASWDRYLAVNNIDHDTFYYEDLLEDTSEYLNALAAHFDVGPLAPIKTTLKIQRDSMTDEWRDQFKHDVEKYGVLDAVWEKKHVQKLTKTDRLIRKIKAFLS